VNQGDVAKWPKAMVCKTIIHRFESGRRLQYSLHRPHPAAPWGGPSVVYSLQTEDGQLIQLSFGPSWFWGPLSDLWPEAVEGASVEIGGNLRDGLPSEDASDVALEQAPKDPVLKVDTLNGAKRAQGKPAWAGGPKVQGPAHPGYAGWSQGQANKAAGAEKAAKPEKPGRPAHAGPKGPREDE
jgi:hypothetical protein